MEEIKRDYYSVGSREDIVVSASSLSYIDPSSGGSPRKFLSFFDKQEEKEQTKSMENGLLIHLYIEKPQEFYVSKVNKPEGMIGDMAFEFYKLIKLNKETQQGEGQNKVTALFDFNSSIGTVTSNITSDLQTENGRQAEILETTAAFEKLSKLQGLTLEQTVIYFRIARILSSAYKSYKEKTLIEKFISEALEYIKDLKVSENKLILTQSTKTILEGVVASLRGNPLANKYFNLSGLFETNLIFKELEVYFETVGIKCKAKIDNVYVDLENKIIYINDLKTTSKPISLYQESLEKWNTARQLTFYKKALITLMTSEDNPFKNIPDILNYEIKLQIIAVETIGNFESQVFNVDEYVKKEVKSIASLLARIDFHIKRNDWTASKESVEGNGVITLIPTI